MLGAVTRQAKRENLAQADAKFAESLRQVVVSARELAEAEVVYGLEPSSPNIIDDRQERLESHLPEVDPKILHGVLIALHNAGASMMNTQD